MKKSTKAALFSLLVFPGTGHLYLRHWLRAAFFFLPAFAAVVFLATYSIERALLIADDILAGEVPADVASIEEALKESPPGEMALILNGAKWLLLACWLGGSFDAARLGRAAEAHPPPS